MTISSFFRGSSSAAVVVVLGAMAVAGCKSKEDKEKAAIVNAERNVDEAAKRAGEAAAQMGNSAAKLGAEGAAAGLEGATAGMAAAAAGLQNAAAAMQAAAGQAGGKVALVDFRALKGLLPESIGDLPRKSAVGEKSGVMGFGMSRAEGSYRGKGDARIDLKLTDAGSMGGVLGAAAFANLEIDKETEDGYERTTTFAGRKALEKYDSKSKHGEIKVFVGSRYIVEIDSHDVAPELLKKAAASIDMAKLEALK
jgi:hypothetical protein